MRHSPERLCPYAGFRVLFKMFQLMKKAVAHTEFPFASKGAAAAALESQFFFV